jgi:glutamyl-tRNA synthetase
VALHDYRTKGYLPDAMVNYLVRLGWAHGDQEVFTREQLVEAFRLEKVGASPGVFDHAKLDWLNAHWIRAAAPERLVDLLTPFWGPAGVDLRAVEARGTAWLAQGIPLFVERVKTLLELAQAMAFLFAAPAAFDPKAAEKFLTPKHLANLAEVRRLVAAASDLTADSLEREVREVAEKSGGKMVDYAQPIRVALTGTAASPPIFPILVLLGRASALERLDRALARA